MLILDPQEGKEALMLNRRNGGRCFPTWVAQVNVSPRSEP